MTKRKQPPDGAEVERLRKVRRSLERRYKTLDAMWAHLLELEKEHRAAGGKFMAPTARKKVQARHKRAS